MKFLFTFKNPLPKMAVDTKVFQSTAKALGKHFKDSEISLPLNKGQSFNYVKEKYGIKIIPYKTRLPPTIRRLFSFFLFASFFIGFQTKPAHALTAAYDIDLTPELDVCRSKDWTAKEFRELPATLQKIRKTTLQILKEAVAKAAKEQQTQIRINSHELENLRLVTNSCPYKKPARLLLQADPDNNEANGRPTVDIVLGPFTRNECWKILRNPSMQGLTPYFINIELDGQPVILGTPDDTYKCARNTWAIAAENKFTFVLQLGNPVSE